MNQLDYEKFSGVCAAACRQLNREGTAPEGWNSKAFRKLFIHYFQRLEAATGVQHYIVKKSALCSWMIEIAEPVRDPKNPENYVRLFPSEYHTLIDVYFRHGFHRGRSPSFASFLKCRFKLIRALGWL